MEAIVSLVLVFALVPLGAPIDLKMFQNCLAILKMKYQACIKNSKVQKYKTKSKFWWILNLR